MCDPVISNKIDEVLFCDFCACEEQEHQLLQCPCKGNGCDQRIRLCNCGYCTFHNHVEFFEICSQCNNHWRFSECKSDANWNTLSLDYVEGPVCPQCTIEILSE